MRIKKLILPSLMTVLLVLFTGALLYAIGLNIWALADCAPQAGKWTPWTGQICYGEPR